MLLCHALFCNMLFVCMSEEILPFPVQFLYYLSLCVMQDCWNRPIASAPDAWIDVMERTAPHGQAYALLHCSDSNL